MIWQVALDVYAGIIVVLAVATVWYVISDFKNNRKSRGRKRIITGFLFAVLIAYLFISFSMAYVDGKGNLGDFGMNIQNFGKDKPLFSVFSKMGELVVVPFIVAYLTNVLIEQGNIGPKKSSVMTSRTVTTETVKIDSNGVEHYEKTTTVTEEE